MKFLKKIETENDIHLVTERPNLVLINETKRVVYNVPVEGVYIQHVNGKLYTSAEWGEKMFSAEEANGVAVYDSRASFVISKTQLGVSRWYPEAVLLDCFVGSETNARLDYGGVANTEVIYVKDGSDNAATKCVDFIFPNGSTGYLPALGEWVVAYDYKQNIDEALTLIGADAIKVTEDNYAYMWSSSQYNEYNTWLWSWLNGGAIYQRKSNFYSGYIDFYVRPFGELVIAL